MISEDEERGIIASLFEAIFGRNEHQRRTLATQFIGLTT